MEASFWLSQWKRFFRKADAKVIDSHVIVKVMKEINKKARSAVNTTGQEGEGAMKPLIFVRGAIGNYHPVPQDSMLDALIAAKQYREDGYDVYIGYAARANDVLDMGATTVIRQFVTGDQHAIGQVEQEPLVLVAPKFNALRVQGVYSRAVRRGLLCYDKDKALHDVAGGRFYAINVHGILPVVSILCDAFCKGFWACVVRCL